MRKTSFAHGEFYHAYNRGVDRRNIFADQFDIARFYQSMDEFNTLDPIGSIYEQSLKKRRQSPLGRETSKQGRLVNIVAYCLNYNHYHLILEQIVDGGISEFMKRLGGGYTKYFNYKMQRSGSLFQGLFKSKHINSNEYLLHVSAYVNLNNRMHVQPELGRETSKLSKSSWDEYVRHEKGFCGKSIILDQFNDAKEYEKFAISSLQSIIERKTDLKELEEILLEEIS